MRAELNPMQRERSIRASLYCAGRALGPVDDEDFRILAALFRSPLASAAAIAGAVGLTRPAVSRRIDRLGSAGVLQGFAAHIAAAVFGRYARLFPFRPDDRPADDLEEILRVDPVVWGSLKHDGGVTVCAYLADPTEEPPRALIDLLGRRPLGSYGSSLPSPRVDDPILSPLDWRVLEALVADPRGSTRRLANATRLSPKTVRTHRDRMIRDGLLAVTPIIESAPSRGVLLYNLALYGLEPEDRPHALALLSKKVVINETRERPMMYLLCQAESLVEVMEVERRLRSVPSLGDVQLTLHKRWACATGRLVGWIRERRDFWDRARASGRRR